MVDSRVARLESDCFEKNHEAHLHRKEKIMSYLLMLNERKKIEEADEQQRHASHNNQDERQAMEPHARSA